MAKHGYLNSFIYFILITNIGVVNNNTQSEQPFGSGVVVMQPERVICPYSFQVTKMNLVIVTYYKLWNVLYGSRWIHPVHIF